MAEAEEIPVQENEGEGWQIVDGRAVARGEAEPWQRESEGLTYNNPFNLEMERVWFDGRVVYAVDCGEVEVDPGQVKVAQEYQPVYSANLDAEGKLAREPELVEGQYNIYDSVPGMDRYSPIWQFNYVVVPRDYEPNRLRSERDCLESGYQVLKSNVFEN